MGMVVVVVMVVAGGGGVKGMRVYVVSEERA